MKNIRVLVCGDACGNIWRLLVRCGFCIWLYGNKNMSKFKKRPGGGGATFDFLTRLCEYKGGKQTHFEES